MNRVEDITNDIVSRLRAIPQLVALMQDGSSANISAYHDEWPSKTNLLEEVRLQQPGRILVAHLASGPGNIGRMEWWRHQFTFYVKPLGKMSDAWYWIVNGVPANGDGQSMLLTDSIGTNLRRVEVPTLQRRFIAPDASNAFFLVDYFEIVWTFGESNQ